MSVGWWGVHDRWEEREGVSGMKQHRWAWMGVGVRREEGLKRG